MVALAALIGGFYPAPALELCTTPDGTLYVGDSHPENCVPRQRSGRARMANEDESAGEPRAALSDEEPFRSESFPPADYSPRVEENDSVESERLLAEAAKETTLSREEHDKLMRQVSSLRVTRGPTGPEIAGTFRNDLGRLLTYVRLDFRLLDEDGKPVDSATASTQFLANGESWDFSASTARPDARGVRLVSVSTSD